MKIWVKTFILAASLVLGWVGGTQAETAASMDNADAKFNEGSMEDSARDSARDSVADLAKGNGAEAGVETRKKHSRSEIRKLLLDANPNLPIKRISKADAADYYEVVVSGTTLYVHDTGRHLFAGDLFRVGLKGLVNVTEANRSERRRDALNSLDESELIVFSPAREQVKTTVSVFTDIDCGYCRKLHQEIPELNRLGIAVRYLAFPRAGAGSDSWDKIVSAWCADDPQLAMTQAKAGLDIVRQACANPVAQHYSLVDDFGITGTPAIIDEEGNLIAGYVPAKELARRLGIAN